MKIIDKREDLTQWEALHHFSYEPTTGSIIRIVTYNKWKLPVQCNRPVKSKNNRGYYWCKTHGLVFLAHRLIWLMMTGHHPSGEIDHINGDRLDNRWVNLRDVTAFDNARNQGERKDNTSGCRGVTRNGAGWMARISHDGVRYGLGTFRNKADAIHTRKCAEEYLEYHPNHAKRESWTREN